MKCLPHLPNIKYYDADNMSVETHEKFLQWYQENQHYPFNLERELLTYCRSDIDILLKACWKFHKLYMQITGIEHPVNPFDYVTIASLCMGTFRAKFLPLLKNNASNACSHKNWECQCQWNHARKLNGDASLEILDTSGKWVIPEDNEILTSKFFRSPVGLILPHRYGRRDNYSKQCIQWIKCMEKERNIQIQNGNTREGEKIVKYYDHFNCKRHYKLDGYYVDEYRRDHALEFNGSWYH